MFDVDFLASDKPQVRQSTIHTYGDGCFRAAVANKMRAIADQRGWIWRDAGAGSLANAIWGGSIFGDSIIHLRIETLREQPASVLTDLAEAIGQKSDVRFFLQGRPGALTVDPTWSAIVQASSVLSEPELTVANVPILVSAAATPVPIGDLTNRAVLDQALKTWVGRADGGLAGFLSLLDMTSLTCVNPDTKTFDLIAFEAMTRSAGKAHAYRWHDALARFLMTPSGGPKATFLQAIDHAFHKEGLEPRSLVAMLFRVTRDLSLVNPRFNPDGSVPGGWGDFRWRRICEHRQLSPSRLLKWQILLAQAEPTLNAGGLVAWADLLDAVQ